VYCVVCDVCVCVWCVCECVCECVGVCAINEKSVANLLKVLH